MKIQRKAPKRQISAGVTLSAKSITEPDLALTTQEILRHHVASADYSIKPQAYDPEGIMDKYSRMEPTERQDYKNKTAQDVNRLKAKATTEAAKQAEAQREAQQAAQEKAKGLSPSEGQST